MEFASQIAQFQQGEESLRQELTAKQLEVDELDKQHRMASEALQEKINQLSQIREQLSAAEANLSDAVEQAREEGRCEVRAETEQRNCTRLNTGLNSNKLETKTKEIGKA